jgi:hypothetical protein
LCPVTGGEGSTGWGSSGDRGQTTRNPEARESARAGVLFVFRVRGRAIQRFRRAGELCPCDRCDHAAERRREGAPAGLCERRGHVRLARAGSDGATRWRSTHSRTSAWSSSVRRAPTRSAASSPARMARRSVRGAKPHASAVRRIDKSSGSLAWSGAPMVSEPIAPGTVWRAGIASSRAGTTRKRGPAPTSYGGANADRCTARCNRWVSPSP